MKSLTEHLWFETPHRRDYINITRTVEELVRKSGVKEGICLVNAMYITQFSGLNRQSYDNNSLIITGLQIFSKRQR